MTQQNPFAEILDTFFNGRPAPKPTPPKGAVTLAEIIARRKSHVRFGGKLYRIEVTEVEEKGKP